MCLRAELPSRQSWANWINTCYAVQSKEALSPALGKAEPQTIETGDWRKVSTALQDSEVQRSHPGLAAAKASNT